MTNVGGTASTRITIIIKCSIRARFILEPISPIFDAKIQYLAEIFSLNSSKISYILSDIYGIVNRNSKTLRICTWGLGEVLIRYHSPIASRYIIISKRRCLTYLTHIFGIKLDIGTEVCVLGILRFRPFWTWCLKALFVKFYSNILIGFDLYTVKGKNHMKFQIVLYRN